MSIGAAKLKKRIEEEAKQLGFCAVAVARPDSIGKAKSRLRTFLDSGFHGTMDWMAETFERRADPKTLWSDGKSIIMLAMNYGPDHDPLEMLENSRKGLISVYAQNRDYHDIIKGRLKQIAQRLASQTGEEVKVFVDTAPVMEKPLAAVAGIGWQGKHTNLVSRDHGSWLFLGSIFTSAELPPDEQEEDHCGSCRACLDICPTDAFPGPYQLDARRCISYLTIEHKGQIPQEFRKPMGNRIYGCDDCLAVCPWNKFAIEAAETKLQARNDLKEPDIEQLLELDEPAFRKMFSGSPVKRIGRNRFIRNVLIAAGNSDHSKLVKPCTAHLNDGDENVRGAAVWALSQLVAPEEFVKLRDANMGREKSQTVLEEWQLAG